MKKEIIIISFFLFAVLTACESQKSNVVDYSGKNETVQKDSETVSEQVESDEQTVAADDTEIYSEEPATVESKSPEEEQASYTIDIIRFDIRQNSYDDSYRYDAIVQVKNTGTENIYLTGTTFDLETQDGKLIQSDDMISMCPDVIKPGETGYLYNQYGTEIDPDADIENIKLNPQYLVKTTSDTPAEYDVSDVSFKDDTYGLKLVGRVTNNTEEDTSYIYINVVYYDQDKNVLGITGTSVTELLAGRTVSFEVSGMDLPEGLEASDVAFYKIFARESFWGF